MQSNSFLLFILMLAGILTAVAANHWLVKWVEPKKSGKRLLVYMILTLFAGFLITIFFSYIILKLWYRTNN